MTSIRFITILMVLALIQSVQMSAQSKYSKEDSIRGSINEYRAYDVRYYNLDLKINPETKSIAGSVIINLDATIDQSKVQVDLFENLKVLAISLNEKSVKYEHNKNAIFIDCKLKKGEQYKLRISYEGKPIIADRAPWDGGFVWKNDIEGNPWIGVACEGIGASLWWPNKDHLSDEPDSMEMHFTVPKPLKVISNGNLISEKSIGSKLTTFSWKVQYPINNYNVSFYIGNYEHIHDTYQASDSSILDLDYYVLPNHKTIAKSHFKQSHKVLRAFEFYFGKYPFWKDGFALVEAPYLGMEHQSAIAYGNEFKQGYLGTMVPKEFDIDYIILHETAHEYFGNSVSCTDLGDMWIHESFATYMEALYIEFYYGKEASQRYLNSQLGFIKNIEPIFGPYGVNYEAKTSDQYYKGSWMLHSLRNTIENDTVWFTILREFYNKFKISHANRDDFIDIVNEYTKSDYTAFIHQYLRWEVPPEMEYKSEFKDNATFLSFRWNCYERAFSMPIEFSLDGKKVKMQSNTEWKTVQFPKKYKEIKPIVENRYFTVKKNN